jgi:membrane protein YqaA with SNARE-associated domain
LYFGLPSVLLWLLLERVPGFHTEPINRIEFFVEFVVWWLGLGILSSIGLGSGLQSGVLFLFPHVIKVCLAAQTCKTLDFESNSNMWFRQPKNLFKCPELTSSSTPVTYLGTWLKIIPVCFLQTAGTAIGEIPPYWFTRAAKLAAIQQGEEEDEIPDDLKSDSQYSIINKFKSWMIRFLRSHGFFGVLLMASYPNIAFDLCGICCGHFLMPFWTFFGATFLGKAVIRNTYQSLLYVVLCSEKYVELLIVCLQTLAPDSLHIDQVIREIIEDARESFKNLDKVKDRGASNSMASTFLFWWQILMAILLGSFLLSCVSHFAQHHQLQIDMEESNKLRARLPKNIRLELTSPISKRLKLPPPTASKNSKTSSNAQPKTSSNIMQSPDNAAKKKE